MGVSRLVEENTLFESWFRLHAFSDKQITEMKELLRKKEADMKAMEDRYKKYVMLIAAS